MARTHIAFGETSVRAKTTSEGTEVQIVVDDVHPQARTALLAALKKVGPKEGITFSDDRVGWIGGQLRCTARAAAQIGCSAKTNAQNALVAARTALRPSNLSHLSVDKALQQTFA